MINAQQQYQATQIYNHGLITMNQGWHYLSVGDYAGATVLYEQASESLYNCCQILGPTTGEYVFSNLATCRFNLGWMTWYVGNPTWVQFYNQALFYLQQALLQNPTNLSYQTFINQINLALGGGEPIQPVTEQLAQSSQTQSPQTGQAADPPQEQVQDSSSESSEGLKYKYRYKSKRVRKNCSSCGGAGSNTRVCGACTGGRRAGSICTNCGGTGVRKNRCSICNGSGKKEEMVWDWEWGWE